MCFFAKKGFIYVLTRRVNNDAIEKRFNLSRHMSRDRLSLNSSKFFHNEQVPLLGIISHLSQKPNSNCDKLLCISFLDEVQSVLEKSEKLRLNRMI